MMTRGFEPLPRKNSTLNCRLRPLGHVTKKAPTAGLEPATLRLEVENSILLSHVGISQ